MRSMILATVLIAVLTATASAIVVDGQVMRPVTTYSIIARDPVTGQLGVAVQSHWFSVGTTVPWIRAGIGAVATQSLTDVTYGVIGLAMMAAGKTAEEALQGAIRSDQTPQWRQVGMIDAFGNQAVHTGRKCIRHAGHVSGDGFIVMANLMERPTVWEAMATAYRESEGELADRMLAALDAAQAEGGDIRGRQSAAIIIVSGDPTGIPFRDTVMDLRVDDHPQPLVELRRLVNLSRAYQFMNDGDERLAQSDAAGAKLAYNSAMELAPDNTEIQFWSAVTLFSGGQEQQALVIFKQVFAEDRRWMEVLRRLPMSDLLANDDGQVNRILAVADQD